MKLVKGAVENDPTKEMINFMKKEMEISCEHELKLFQLIFSYRASNSYSYQAMPPAASTGIPFGLQFMNTEMEGLKLKITLLETAKEDLHTQQLYAESYSRRENLKFFGLAERETKDNQEGSEAINTRNILFEFLRNGVGIETPEKKIELQRVHRLGKPISGKTRPIIARFLRYQDREMVSRASFHLQDSEVKVLEDYPQEIIERRRKQIKKLKEAKKSGMKASFSKAEPDKLYINGKFIPM